MEVVALGILAVMVVVVLLVAAHFFAGGRSGAVKPGRAADGAAAAAAVVSPRSGDRNKEAVSAGTPGSRKGTPKQKGRRGGGETGVATHELLAGTVKSSAGVVTCMAIHPEGTALAMACTDSSVRVMPVDFSSAENPLAGGQTTRALIEGMDVATAMDFSQDGNSLFIALDYRCNLARLRIAANDRHKALSEISKCKTSMHSQVVRFLVSSRGQYIVTAGSEEETQIKLWNYSGDLLASCDTKQIRNYQVNVSPVDARFFGAACWTSGVKVWEAVVARGSTEPKVEKAMELSTSCGSLAFAISPDNKRAVVVTKYLNILLWNIDVRYKVSEDPKKLLEVKEEDQNFQKVSSVEYSPDGKFLIFCSERNIRIRDATTLQEVGSVLNAHGGHIDRVVIPQTLSGRIFLSYSGDEKPRLWKFRTQSLAT